MCGNSSARWHNARGISPSERQRKSVRQYRYIPKAGLKVRRALAAVCFGAALILCTRLYRYGADSMRTMQTNQAAAALYHAAEAAEVMPVETAALIPPGASGTPMGKETAAPKSTATPPPMFQQVTGKVSPKFKPLLKANPDVVGWLSIQGELDLPVVYRNNTYYLTRDVYKQKSAAGVLFLDENHPLSESAQHLVIHGHNMKDGTMFGELQRYLKLDYLQKHGKIQFDTLYQRNTYVVFAVLVIPESSGKKGYVNFMGHPSFSSAKQFLAFIQELKTGSVFSIPVKVEAYDALLTLSTCYGKDRLLVTARRVRSGESADELAGMLDYAFGQ